MRKENEDNEKKRKISERKKTNDCRNEASHKECNLAKKKEVSAWGLGVNAICKKFPLLFHRVAGAGAPG